MDEIKIWELIRHTHAHLVKGFEPALQSLFQKTGLEPNLWGTLLATQTFEPEFTTPSHLLVRVPYYTPEVYSERLEKLSAHGMLKKVDDGRYQLASKGRKAVNDFIDLARQAMVSLDPLPAQSSSRLAILLGRLVEASLNASEPPRNWSISLSFKLMPPVHPPLPYTEQAFSCLAAYRDDAYLAAWRDTGLSAMALEELSLLWQSAVASYEEICRKLAYRGHSCEVYNIVLRELRNLGFVDGPDHDLRLTSAGRMYRSNIEELTDRYFFAPWRTLRKPEKDELYDLLQQLHTAMAEGVLRQN
jgi:Mn-dependent DtxR family transcriptional regulator